MKFHYGLCAAALCATALVASGCSSGVHESSKAPAAAPRSAGPVSADQAAEFDKLIAAYHNYALQECDALAADTKDFAAAVTSGDLDKAKRLYPSTRLHYERIEPISEALGELDFDIDARENDVQPGNWRGYHKLEKILWGDDPGVSKEQEAAYAERLVNDVNQLRAKVGALQMDIPMLISGAVTLLNEVSTLKVTGEEDRYSHTDLYDFAANIEGAQQIFEVLRAQVEQHDAELAKTIAGRFDAMHQALAPYKTQDGFVSYHTLTNDQTKQLSRAVDALAEPLSMMGNIVATAD